MSEPNDDNGQVESHKRKPLPQFDAHETDPIADDEYIDRHGNKRKILDMKFDLVKSPFLPICQEYQKSGKMVIIGSFTNSRVEGVIKVANTGYIKVIKAIDKKPLYISPRSIKSLEEA